MFGHLYEFLLIFKVWKQFEEQACCAVTAPTLRFRLGARTHWPLVYANIARPWAECRPNTVHVLCILLLNCFKYRNCFQTLKINSNS
jgi:hypothetical protein